MSTYISLINYTQGGIADIKSSPKRLSVVKRLAKKLGGKNEELLPDYGRL